jgi:hypothetical protein
VPAIKTVATLPAIKMTVMPGATAWKFAASLIRRLVPWNWLTSGKEYGYFLLMLLGSEL